MRARLFGCLIALFASVHLSAQSPGASPGLAAYQPKPYVQLKHPDWAKSAAIYQMNLRQFTPEGTFRAAEKDLPRLKQLGIGIIWLMPIHKIGALHRKGSLGSPYAVEDYYSVNPEFGTLDDLKHFVAAVFFSRSPEAHCKVATYFQVEQLWTGCYHHAAELQVSEQGTVN